MNYNLPVECKTPAQIAAEVKYLNDLFAQPLPIISACNRLQRRTDRAMKREWMKGVGVTVLAALVAAGLVWWLQ